MKNLARASAALLGGLLAGWPFAAPAQLELDRLRAPWPAPESVAARVDARAVEFPSRSPFKITDIGNGEPATTAQGTLFLPPGGSPARPAPAVVMLHGSGGVLAARELTYGRQLAAMGIAALAVDSFAARRDRATAFLDRLIEITETMMMADAYSGLAWLAGFPEIDRRRVALVGFSYGAMATLYAAHELVARRLAPDGLRFAAHAAFYGPCIARFDDTRTTGAPVLMLMGGRDAILDPIRCQETAEDLRRGGSRVEAITYPDAVHQWDGGFYGPRPIGRVLSDCRLSVERDGTIRDERTWLPMTGPLLRKVILGLCAGSEPYLIGRDDAVRARSNFDLGRFLAEAFAR